MKKEFWIEKWNNNQTGFHKDFTHPLLIKFIDKFNMSEGDTVFVPLCGKSLDILWLAQQGYHVIGVEVSELAVCKFFTENNLKFTKISQDGFEIYKHKNITIFRGDFFAMLPEHTIDVKAVYDRAAFIALPDDIVSNYVNKLKEIIPKGAQTLLITLEFEKTSGPIGPPFNSPDIKVNKLFKQYSSVEMVQQEDIISREHKFKEQGCDYVYERVYLIVN